MNLLQEAVRMKGTGSKRKAVRDLLASAVADYNKITPNKVWGKNNFQSWSFPIHLVRVCHYTGLEDQRGFEEGHLWSATFSARAA